ncbi:MAG: SpoIIE family protein phosphatase [Gammaproteobacteria bacterium]|nr:SpoIIE family protein phosphatase [Gammaproteobacteria bacterium]MBT3725531.1 SpoIIE family protein phosphatase [Gammaproteobacteria bacterium]MBT4193942.1 SpoIIE family protein phosphatase [Gammaproteobacteria bacterium]MBT4448847.1 SpoIIE family protein phosphatase [Gammaproteobacteria bacterium]MBT4860861.1 SpoIIE family protein phosphatase [Gammaproteobacteria bacterium]
MKQSIIFKTLLVIGTIIVLIFVASGYLVSQSDNKLIAKIVAYNLDSTMKALDYRQEISLKKNQLEMQAVTNMIVKNSSTFLQNFDVDGLKENLLFDMKGDGIKAIKVWDSSMNELFLLAYKDNGKIFFKNTLPKSYADYTQFKKPIHDLSDKVYNKKIGEIVLFYDESIITKAINELKKQAVQDINSFNETIDHELLQANVVKLSIAIGFLVIILTVISILLMVYVNNPLKILKSGLDDFFLFLQNKKNSTQTIMLNTSDEFGQMAYSLNENISVSAKLHEEIRGLNFNLEQKVKARTSELAEINQELQDSIEYASTIQRSFVKDISLIKNSVTDAFSIWQPRDKVGGDLYIHEESAEGILFGVIDCTGHSVPGGFMTMLAGSVIKRLASEFFKNPAKLLSELNKAIKYQLSQEGESSLSDDGLDMGLCYINKQKNTLLFSGAKLDLVYFKNDEINIIKANKQSIGYKKSNSDYEYTNHEIHVDGSESFYLYSDGITDQVGGLKNFPYGNKKFKQLLSSIQNKSMTEQEEIITDTLLSYQGENSRRDDVTVIGFRL